MNSLRPGYKALVIGTSGGIGSAIVKTLEADANCGGVFSLSRTSFAGFDITNQQSVEAAAEHLSEQAGELDVVFNATGALVLNDVQPEKSLKAIDTNAMAMQFAVNAIGPALLLKHFHGLLPRDRHSIFASISARVGSIGDNRLGGWYSYRASKAAQNQIVHTAAIEIARSRPQAVVVAIHPGTVATGLSEAFSGGRDRLSPESSAEKMLTVLDRLSPGQSGGFFAYDGKPIEW